MLLTSPSFEHGAQIPKKFTCDGGSINPELEIQNVPEGAKSLALIVYDPDAPISGGFAHWVVWNINPETMFVKQESIPPGAIEGLNDTGRTDYAGPCPPVGHGVHHYHFKLFALDALLDLPSDTTSKDLMPEIKKHLVEETELVGTYER